MKFIESAQNQKDGGWRYHPGDPGDTSVVGWQVMALKSAQLAGLETRSSTMPLVNKFLDSVEDLDGAAYGYRTPNSARDSMTSVGLLCRMYLGWGKDKPALERGVKLLSQRGPSISHSADMYFVSKPPGTVPISGGHRRCDGPPRWSALGAKWDCPLLRGRF